jgi:hypothetical protein
MNDAHKLDLDLWKSQDDKRFTELLKTDWVSASKEVAQVAAGGQIWAGAGGQNWATRGHKTTPIFRRFHRYCA